MNLRVATDSASDYSQEEAKALGIDVIPLGITVDGELYLDGIDMSKDLFYDLLINKKKFPKTSQPTQQQFIELFEDAKNKNQTLLYISLASGLSGTYQGALMAKETVGYDNIYVVDGGTLVAGQQILVELALKLDKEGKSIDEIIERINNVKKRIVILACMNTLEYVKRGGRGGKIFSFLGNLINIKPIITFNEKGGADILAKPFGQTRGRVALIKEMDAHKRDKDYPIYYYYSYNKANLDEFVDRLKKLNKYDEGKTVNLSPAVGCHIGDNAYAVCYVMEE